MTTEIRLTGLDGSNPLAFLAALGTLRTLDLAHPSTRPALSWDQDGCWLPCLHLRESWSNQDLVDRLTAALGRTVDHPAWATFRDLAKISPADYRAYLDKGLAETASRWWCDLGAALATDAVLEGGFVAPTAFKFTAGQQHFFEKAGAFVTRTAPEHLRVALFGPWVSERGQAGMRWDPGEVREYAHRWKDPSPALEQRTVPGANRLALEALALHPTVAARWEPRTSGFAEVEGYKLCYTWPVWVGWLGADSIRSLLSLAELGTVTPDRRSLAAWGIAEVYRCRRFRLNKYYGCFSPSWSA